MSYQLRTGEILGEGVGRVCCQQIERAIMVSRSQRTERHSPVHETRKHLKKARAALRLLSGVVSREEFARAHERLLHVADLISDIRDAEVRFQTMQQLGHLLRIEEDGIVQEAEAFLGLELDSFLAAFSDWKKQAARGLRKVRRRMSEWPVDHLTRGQIGQAVRQSYRQSRKALRKANKTPTAENFHEFRKRAKELMYQLRILQPLHPLRMRQMVSDLEVITETLGKAHDLAFLEKRLIKHSRRGGNDRAAGALSELIGLREKELQRMATALGQKFCAARPKDFGAQIAEFLNDWAIEKRESRSQQSANGFRLTATMR